MNAYGWLEPVTRVDNTPTFILIGVVVIIMLLGIGLVFKK